jgi:hypothetical protein
VLRWQLGRLESMQLLSPFVVVAFAGVHLAGGQADLQDAMEGIEGLMQRFEELQPQLRTLARSDLEAVAAEGQQLNVRFLDLQDRLGAAGAGGPGMVVPTVEEGRLIGFHRDLALFMARVEGKLGITGPVPSSRLAFDGQASGMPLTDIGQANARTSPAPFQSRADAAPSTDERLQATMRKVAEGMQRFEALHPHLRSLSPQVFNEIASRGQRLHEEFQTLQRRGAELSSTGGASDADAMQYVASFEAFAVEQAAFVRDAEAQVQRSMSGGTGIASAAPSGMGGFAMPTGMGGSAMPTGMGGSAMPTGMGGSAMPTGLPGMSQTAAGGRVTPATDGRLSNVISKIVARMQEFEGLKVQFSRLPQQTFSSIAQRAQALNNRFVALQQIGTRIAGDGSSPMLESDALSYAAEMEAFHTDQAAFVDEAKRVVHSGGLGFAGGGMVGAPLGSATLNSASSNAFGQGSGLGLPPLGAAPAVAPLGAAGFGSASFGQPPGASGLRPLGATPGFGTSAGLSGAQFGANSQTMNQFGSPSAFSSGMR